MAAPKSDLLTASFTVAGADLNEQSALGTCRILRGITEQTDAMIVRAIGSLDYSKLQVKHYHLDMVGSAKLYDTVLIHTYVRSHQGSELAIELRAVRRRGRREVPLVNGSFVFVVREQVPIRYSPS